MILQPIGTIKQGREIGRVKGRLGSAKYVLAACVDCGKGRWVEIVSGHVRNRSCPSCNIKEATKYLSGKRLTGKDNPKWKGGRTFNRDGYTLIQLPPRDPLCSMIQKNGYVLEHRLVMAKHLGRCLERWEVVHHKNHVRGDNRIENLQLFSGPQHLQISVMENRVRYLEKVIDKQEKRIQQLERQIKTRGNIVV